MTDIRFCTGCLKDGENNQAESWCVDCSEPICWICARVHKRLSPPHKVTCFSKIESVTQEFLSIPKYCGHHSSDKLTFFCCQHDVMVCDTCVTNNHSKCKPITLEKAAKGVAKGTAMSDLEKRVKNLAAIIEKMIDDDLNRKTSIQRKIRQIKQQIVSYLDKLERELSQDVEKKCSQRGTSATLEMTLKKEFKLICKWIADLTSLKENASEMHLFQVLKLLDKQVNKKEEEIKQTRLLIVPDVHFSPSESATNFEKLFPTFGTITVNMPNAPKPMLRLNSHGQTAVNTTRLKLVSTFQTSKLAEDVMISHCCFIPGPRLLLSAFGQKQLFICNTDGTGTQSIKLDYTPYNITLYDKYTALVSSDSDFIQTINLKDLSIGRKVKGSRNCKDISCRNDEIWIMSAHKKLTAVDINGEVLKELSTTFSPGEMCVHKSGYIYCTDKVSQVYAISPEGEERVVYSNSDLRNSKGVAIDDQGYIYVSGAASNNIHRVSPDGKNNSVILTEKDGIKRLTAMTFSSTTNELMAINDYTSVLIFKFV